MAMMFNKRNPIEITIDDLTRELVDTRTRCRQLEELLGVGQDDALPSRNAVIARAETDAAIIRVHAQRIADRILDQAEQDARAIRRGTAAPRPTNGVPGALVPSPSEPPVWPPLPAPVPPQPTMWPAQPGPAQHAPAPSESAMWPTQPGSAQHTPAPSESAMWPAQPGHAYRHTTRQPDPESWRERLQPKPAIRLDPVPAQSSSPDFYEPWAGREQVADLWDIAPDELDASIDRFMSTAMERSSRDLLLGH